MSSVIPTMDLSDDDSGSDFSEDISKEEGLKFLREAIRLRIKNQTEPATILTISEDDESDDFSDSEVETVKVSEAAQKAEQSKKRKDPNRLYVMKAIMKPDAKKQSDVIHYEHFPEKHLGVTTGSLPSPPPSAQAAVGLDDTDRTDHSRVYGLLSPRPRRREKGSRKDENSLSIEQATALLSKLGNIGQLFVNDIPWTCVA